MAHRHTRANKIVPCNRLPRPAPLEIQQQQYQRVCNPSIKRTSERYESSIYSYKYCVKLASEFSILLVSKLVFFRYFQNYYSLRISLPDYYWKPYNLKCFFNILLVKWLANLTTSSYLSIPDWDKGLCDKHRCLHFQV